MIAMMGESSPLVLCLLVAADAVTLVWVISAVRNDPARARARMLMPSHRADGFETAESREHTTRSFRARWISLDVGKQAAWGRPLARLTRQPSRDARTVRSQLPLLCEAMARDLRGGVSISAALWSSASACSGALAEDIDQVQQRVSGGTPFVDALASWTVVRPIPELSAFVAAARVGLEVGGELAPAFDACAAALRDRLEVDDEVRALTAQSRASGVLLTALPWVAAAGLALVNPESGRFLVSTTAGGVCLAVGVLLDVAGWAWMSRLVEGSR